MNYTIATMKEVQSEYDWEIMFTVSGNKYEVACRYLDGEQHVYKYKEFDNKTQAVAFWNQQSLNILDSSYSKKDRLAQFN